MNKQVYDYFEDLDKKKLPRKKHHLIYDGERIINNVITREIIFFITYPPFLLFAFYRNEIVPHS